MSTRRIMTSVVASAVLMFCAAANAAPPPALTIQFINRTADIPGLWDETVRSEFVEAMNLVASNVSSEWLHARTVIVNSDVRSQWRLIIVGHPLNYGGELVAGYHSRDAQGPYAIFSLAAAGNSVAQVFLDGSHELAEMLVDPSATRFINGWYAEVADPVVCCHYDIRLSDGSVQPVNDFVLPHWFVQRASAPYDFINSPYVRHPLEVGPDGFKQHR